MDLNPHSSSRHPFELRMVHAELNGLIDDPSEAQAVGEWVQCRLNMPRLAWRDEVAWRVAKLDRPGFA